VETMGFTSCAQSAGIKKAFIFRYIHISKTKA
jgi:hypothetical protein